MLPLIARHNFDLVGHMSQSQHPTEGICTLFKDLSQVDFHPLNGLPLALVYGHRPGKYQWHLS